MPQRNVLLICVDHWPGRYIGGLGHPTVLTPTLDTMMQNGVTFTNAYSTTPTCIPARRELYTGTFSRTHGDRVFSEKMPMPALPTLQQSFRNAGYQAQAVGKLHVYPQRDRIGFDDVLLLEEGRHHLGGGKDDFELFLQEQGYAGQELTHGMGNNEYMVRPWHLPERCHPTNWTTREACKMIYRRDPTRPAFWYVSYQHPHPPLAPVAEYLDMYRHMEIDMPFMGEWAADPEAMPYALRSRRNQGGQYSEAAIRLARQAFYAQCTYVDHQMRLLIGTLREQGLLENTILGFICDHGDMLGNHGLYAKTVFYEDSARIPMLLVPAASDPRGGQGVRDERLATLADVMPTLLEMCDLPVPESVEGLSLIGPARREYIYGEHNEDARATRMIHDGRYKLIYYPVGNRSQLFDLREDPRELRDLSAEPALADTFRRLTDRLVACLYGGDLEWVRDGKLLGLPDRDYSPAPNKAYSGQRGWRF